METRNIFENLSCIDHRYSLSEADAFAGLSKYISEEASIRSHARCEAALVKAHLKMRGQLTDAVAKKLDEVADNIDPQEVYAEEEKTKHNIRALVNVMKTKVDSEIGPLIHLGATSVDILDTGLSCRMRDVTKNVVLPELKKLENYLCDIAERECATPQVGRTHGQHAVPITFGWSIAEFVARLGKSILRIEELSNQLVGKLAGPVGSYNGPSMIVKDPEELERTYTEFLGLQPSEYSNQLVEPEHVLRLLLEMNVAFGIIAWNTTWMDGYQEVGVFSFCLVGSLLGFLIFNTHPAKVFMGDLGSLALGGALATIAVITRHEISLALIGGIFVIETLSSLIQIIAITKFHKKVFLRAPLHHHFEVLGWDERDIVKMFWTIGLILAMAAITYGVWL